MSVKLCGQQLVTGVRFAHFPRPCANLLIVATLLTFTILAPATDNPCKRLVADASDMAVSGQAQPTVDLIKFDPDTFEFKGLTTRGLEVLKHARDVLRERRQLFDSELRNLRTVHHAATIARLLKANMFLYGPPGSAKTAFVNWLISGEGEPAYKLQLHQMITAQDLTGGQNFEAAKQGRFEINAQGSLADHTIALLDEIQNANPAAMSTLLSLLSEREVLGGNRVVKSRLETLFVTSNANLPEFFQQFAENGQGLTAPALLNRFQFKGFIYNWLHPQDQAVLDERRQRRRYLHALAQVDPTVLHDQVFLQPKQLDWDALRLISHSLFQPSPLFMVVYRELVEDIRGQTNRAIKESEHRHRSNRLDEPFVYFPSADYSERLRQQIPEVIMISAFLDFLMSPLASDAVIGQSTSTQIEIDPLSLWRGYLVMTTIGPGEVRLTLEPNRQDQVDIDFGWAIDAASARDAREELLIQNLKTEQERFRRTLLKHLASLRRNIEYRAKHSHLAPWQQALDEYQPSFELLVLRYQQE